MMNLAFWKSSGSGSGSGAVVIEPEEGDPAPVEIASVAAATPAPMPTRGPSRKPQMSVEERAEYIRVAEEIGIDCSTDLTREKLRAVLLEENIHVYNNDQVIHYLDEKLGADWEWRGLRSVDVAHLKGWYTEKSDTVRRVDFADAPYRGAIPLPVLLTIQKIQRAVPEVYFYVSAPKHDDGDPFLMVTNQWMGGYIVERWDEPGFRER